MMPVESTADYPAGSILTDSKLELNRSESTHSNMAKSMSDPRTGRFTAMDPGASVESNKSVGYTAKS